MRCPHCQNTEDDAAPECSKCGFVLDKWRRAQAAGASAAAAAPLSGGLASPAAAQEGGWDLWVWVVLLAATIGVWRVSRMGEEPASQSAAVGPGRIVRSAAAQAPAGARDAWRFEGRALDLARLSPVKGGRIVLTDFETGTAFETQTDDEGAFSIELAPRWKLGYALSFLHPAYHDRWWPASVLSSPRRDRLRLGVEPVPEGGLAEAWRGGRDKGPVRKDIAVFPRDLSDEERQEAGL